MYSYQSTVCGWCSVDVFSPFNNDDDWRGVNIYIFKQVGEGTKKQPLQHAKLKWH